MGPGSRYTIMVPTKPKKEFQLLKILLGLEGVSTTWEGTQREAGRIPPQTSFQSEPKEVIIILLQLAKSERKCLFTENTVILQHLCKMCPHLL